MIVQKESPRECGQAEQGARKRVVVGGPFVTTTLQALEGPIMLCLAKPKRLCLRSFATSSAVRRGRCMKRRAARNGAHTHSRFQTCRYEAL